MSERCPECGDGPFFNDELRDHLDGVHRIAPKTLRRFAPGADREDEG